MFSANSPYFKEWQDQSGSVPTGSITASCASFSCLLSLVALFCLAAPAAL